LAELELQLTEIKSFCEGTMRIILFLTFFGLALSGSHYSIAETWKFTNGEIFKGEDFQSGEFCISAGVFVEACPENPDHEMDLGGGYIVPPFAEGHHHTVLFGGWREEMFLEHGIVYTWIMANSVNFGRFVREKYAGPETMDFSLAMASLTDPDGHPLQIGFNFHDTVEEIEGDWVHTITTEDELAAKWPRVVASNPDFIKLFLVNSEDYNVLKSDLSIPIRYKGLAPELALPIVKFAKSAGLDVAAHVRTAHDFHVAIEAGVDVIAHLPGFAIGPSSSAESEIVKLVAELDNPERFLISSRDADMAAKSGTLVVTTVGDNESGLLEAGIPENLARKIISVSKYVQNHNLALLKNAGVEILIGSDAGEGHSVNEAISLGKRGIFSNLEILTSLAVLTPQAIFPKRKIGRIAPGYEGSFLLLRKNPLESLDNLKSPVFVFKEGHILLDKTQGN